MVFTPFSSKINGVWLPGMCTSKTVAIPLGTRWDLLLQDLKINTSKTTLPGARKGPGSVPYLAECLLTEGCRHPGAKAAAQAPPNQQNQSSSHESLTGVLILPHSQGSDCSLLPLVEQDHHETSASVCPNVGRSGTGWPLLTVAHCEGKVGGDVPTGT